MFDKFEHACEVFGYQGQYAKLHDRDRRHHVRFKRRVEMYNLKCQECGGVGGETDVILDDGTGPWEECSLCEGTGKLTPHLRGLWLRWKREEKRGQKVG